MINAQYISIDDYTQKNVGSSEHLTFMGLFPVDKIFFRWKKKNL